MMIIYFICLFITFLYFVKEYRDMVIKEHEEIKELKERCEESFIIIKRGL